MFVQRCARKIHKMMTKNFTKFRSMAWVIDRKPLDRMERHFHRIDRKDIEGNYSFRVNTQSKMMMALDRKTLVDYMAIATRLPPQYMLAPESVEFILKELARRHDLNETRINLQKPKAPMPGPMAALAGGPAGPGSGNAFMRDGGAAQLGAAEIPAAMGVV